MAQGRNMSLSSFLMPLSTLWGLGTQGASGLEVPGGPPPPGWAGEIGSPREVPVIHQL